jgi:hypothetical protein
MLGVGHGFELLKLTFWKARKKIYSEDGGSNLLKRQYLLNHIKQSYTPEHSDLQNGKFRQPEPLRTIRLRKSSVKGLGFRLD